MPKLMQKSIHYLGEKSRMVVMKIPGLSERITELEQEWFQLVKEKNSLTRIWKESTRQLSWLKTIRGWLQFKPSPEKSLAEI